MGVFKEHAHAFETVERNQTGIFNNACDYGYSYNTAKPPQVIKDLIFFVNDLKDSSLIVNRETWGKGTNNAGVSLKIQIGWEIDEGMECGTEYNISFNKLNSKHPDLLQKGNNAFISVNSESYKKSYFISKHK